MIALGSLAEQERHERFAKVDDQLQDQSFLMIQFLYQIDIFIECSKDNLEFIRNSIKQRLYQVIN